MGIENLIELFRGESKLRAPLAKGFGERSGKFFTPDKNFARHIAQGGSMSQGNLIKDIFGKVKSLKIPQELYKKLGGNSLEVIIDNPELLGKAKTNVLQTFLARAGSFTPLAMKGLTYLSSLPVATITMFLQSTPANSDEINMKLEDFAMLANKEKEGIETIDIGAM